MTDLEFLSRRVLSLEKRQRWITRAAIVACLMVVAGVILAQGPLPRDRPLTHEATRTPEDEVRARHFVVVDSKGKDRASLVADDAGSVFLVMFDSAGKTRANVSVGNEGPSLVFYDVAGQPRTIIGSTSLVASHVNENGIAERSPASSIVLFDKAGKLIWREP